VPAVRAEIRGTAGRRVASGSFAVGRAAECEVQAVGDPTVLPVHCIVISVPGGIVVADLWSDAGTTVMQRHNSHLPDARLPSPACAPRTPFVVAHGERVTMRIGARTTLTLGPSAKKLEKKQKKEKREKKEKKSRGKEGRKRRHGQSNSEEVLVEAEVAASPSIVKKRYVEGCSSQTSTTLGCPSPSLAFSPSPALSASSRSHSPYPRLSGI